MKLTRASHYALIALTHMAQQDDSKAVASNEIARERNIPERFLLKVLKPLVDAKILRSNKGPGGGYVLNRAPSEITMLDIIEAADDGPIAGVVPPPFQKNEKRSQKKKLKKDRKDKKEKPPNPNAEKNNIPVNNKLLVVCKANADVVREHLRTVKLSDLATKDGTAKTKPRRG